MIPFTLQLVLKFLQSDPISERFLFDLFFTRKYTYIKQIGLDHDGREAWEKPKKKSRRTDVVQPKACQSTSIAPASAMLLVSFVKRAWRPRSNVFILRKKGK